MTRVVILAAGEGTRLRPLTNQLPKTLVPFAGATLLERQFRVLRAEGIRQISIVAGHAAEHLQDQGANVYLNPRFAQTNMVASLACAQELFDGEDDVIVAYGDIAYQPRVLRNLLDCQAPLSIAVDLQWLALWQLRMDDPLADAETLKVDAQGRITELGRKPRSLEDIQGQYIGLFKVSRTLAPNFLRTYADMDSSTELDGKPKDQIFMTSYLQLLIDRGLQAQAVFIRGGWLEIDSLQDLQRYEDALESGLLKPIYDPAA